MNWLSKIYTKLFTIPCHKCDVGRISHSHTGLVGNVDIEVFICDTCGEQFI